MLKKYKATLSLISFDREHNVGENLPPNCKVLVSDSPEELDRAIECFIQNECYYLGNNGTCSKYHLVDSIYKEAINEE